jgi:hypothetical protein
METVKISWDYPRPDLAKRYLHEFQSLGAKAITIFAGRGLGKTHFLKNDLAPYAFVNGRLPVYVDVWQDRGSPALGVANSLKAIVQRMEGIDPKKRDFNEFSVSFMGFGGGIKAPHKPEANEPANDNSRIGFWCGRLADLAGKRKVMLMLDEVQSLALHPDGVNVASALRAAFNTHWGQFEPVFTGSHRDRLLMMFSNSRAPLFNYSDHHEFQLLDRRFTEFVADIVRNVSGVAVDVDELDKVFGAFGRRPRELINVAADMLRMENFDLPSHLAGALQNQATEYAHLAALRGLRPLDHVLLSKIVNEEAVFTQEACAEMAATLGIDNVSTGAVQKSIARLRDENLIWQASRGVYRIMSDDLIALVKDFNHGVIEQGRPRSSLLDEHDEKDEPQDSGPEP